MKVNLRDYQLNALEQARAAIREGARSVLVVAPTGAGKTVLAAALMEKAQAKGRRATFVVDRLSLVNQTSETFDRYGIDHGVIQGDHPRFRPSKPVQICSVQSLARRGWPESSVDVIDEAHVLHAAHKKRIEERKSIVIGLTATPFTRGLGKWFDVVINVTTTRALIERRWLVPYRMYSCAAPDMEGVTISSTGEWDEREASQRALEVVGDVVAEYLKHGESRKFICSAVDTVHVDELHRQFQAAGINTATFTYKDGEEDRADVSAEFRKPDSGIRGLITVTAASRGFDVPDVSCVIMARPLRKSLAEHIQLLGRGMRISSQTGKVDCIVLDHSGNAARFFGACETFFDNGLDALDDGQPKIKKTVSKSAVEPLQCPSCRLVHVPMPHCPACGHAYPRRQTVQHVPGTLKELITDRPSKTLSRDAFAMVKHYVVHTRKRDGEAGRRMAQALMRELTGSFARANWEQVGPVEPSAEVLGKLRHLQIKFALGRGAPARAPAKALTPRSHVSRTPSHVPGQQAA